MLTLRSTVVPGGIQWTGTTSGAGWVHLVTTLAGEDQTRNVMQTVNEMGYTVIGTSGGNVIKASAGSVGAVTVIGAPSTGNLTLHDSAAGSTSAQQVSLTLSLSASSETSFNPAKYFANGITATIGASLASTASILIWWK